MKSEVENFNDYYTVGILKNFVLRFSFANILDKDEANLPLPAPGTPEIKIRDTGYPNCLFNF